MRLPVQVHDPWGGAPLLKADLSSNLGIQWVKGLTTIYETASLCLFPPEVKAAHFLAELLKES